MTVLAELAADQNNNANTVLHSDIPADVSSSSPSSKKTAAEIVAAAAAAAAPAAEGGNGAAAAAVDGENGTAEEFFVDADANGNNNDNNNKAEEHAVVLVEKKKEEEREAEKKKTSKFVCFDVDEDTEKKRVQKKDGTKKKKVYPPTPFPRDDGGNVLLAEDYDDKADDEEPPSAANTSPNATYPPKNSPSPSPVCRKQDASTLQTPVPTPFFLSSSSSSSQASATSSFLLPSSSFSTKTDDSAFAVADDAESCYGSGYDADLSFGNNGGDGGEEWTPPKTTKAAMLTATPVASNATTTKKKNGKLPTEKIPFSLVEEDRSVVVFEKKAGGSGKDDAPVVVEEENGGSPDPSPVVRVDEIAGKYDRKLEELVASMDSEEATAVVGETPYKKKKTTTTIELLASGVVDDDDDVENTPSYHQLQAPKTPFQTPAEGTEYSDPGIATTATMTMTGDVATTNNLLFGLFSPIVARGNTLLALIQKGKGDGDADADAEKNLVAVLRRLTGEDALVLRLVGENRTDRRAAAKEIATKVRAWIGHLAAFCRRAADDGISTTRFCRRVVDDGIATGFGRSIDWLYKYDPYLCGIVCGIPLGYIKMPWYFLLICVTAIWLGVSKRQRAPGVEEGGKKKEE